MAKIKKSVTTLITDWTMEIDVPMASQKGVYMSSTLPHLTKLAMLTPKIDRVYAVVKTIIMMMTMFVRGLMEKSREKRKRMDNFPNSRHAI